MENRRNFFKAITLFATGFIANKVNSMVPKKEEEKEELMVSEHIVITDNGEEYHPLVVKKRKKVVLKGDLSNIPRNNGIVSPLDLKKAPTADSGSLQVYPSNKQIGVIGQLQPPKSSIRKLNQ
jgi:hypothetical protein